MTTKLIATEESTTRHYGSVYGGGSVLSSFDSATPDFVTIEGDKIMTSNNTIDTPSHEYDAGLFHSHLNQTVDDRQQSFVMIEEIPILVVDDKNTINDTRIIDSGDNDFITIEV